LARFRFVTSTRAKALQNIKRNGPFLHRDLVPFYSAIDSYKWRADVKASRIRTTTVTEDAFFSEVVVGEERAQDV